MGSKLCFQSPLLLAYTSRSLRSACSRGTPHCCRASHQQPSGGKRIFSSVSKYAGKKLTFKEKTDRILQWEQVICESSTVYELQEKLLHQFADRNLLITSMLHKSALRAGEGVALRNPDGTLEDVSHLGSNERLEWLGDRVFGLAVGAYCFRKNPTASEGELNLISTDLVSREGMNKLGDALGLVRYLVISQSVPSSPKGVVPSRLGNFLESLFGALYLDGGHKAVQRYFDTCCVPHLEQLIEDADKNYKGALLMLLQEHGFVPNRRTFRFEDVLWAKRKNPDFVKGSRDTEFCTAVC